MSGAVAQRYARALFELAQEKNIIDAVEQDLATANETMAASADLRKFLTHPQMATSAKKEVIDSIFSGKLNEAVVNLFKLLIDRGRESSLPELFNEFVSLANDARGIADATVTTAIPLDEAELQRIAATFGAKVGKTLRVSSTVDPNIVGGVIIRIGDRLYDGSIAGKLARFKSTIGKTKAL